jgi:hypothetical protein
MFITNALNRVSDVVQRLENAMKKRNTEISIKSPKLESLIA